MKNKFYIVTIILIFFASCSKPKERPCWKFNGEIKSNTIDINSALRSIELKDDINLILINDSLNYMIIEGPENIIDFLQIGIFTLAALPVVPEILCSKLKSTLLHIEDLQK